LQRFLAPHGSEPVVHHHQVGPPGKEGGVHACRSPARAMCEDMAICEVICERMVFVRANKKKCVGVYTFLSILHIFIHLHYVYILAERYM
jgi:hypothetical protein